MHLLEVVFFGQGIKLYSRRLNAAAVSLPSFFPDPPWVGVLSALHDFCLKNTAHNKRCSITAVMRNGPGDNYSHRTARGYIHSLNPGQDRVIHTKDAIQGILDQCACVYPPGLFSRCDQGIFLIGDRLIDIDHKYRLIIG